MFKLKILFIVLLLVDIYGIHEQFNGRKDGPNVPVQVASAYTGIGNAPGVSEENSGIASWYDRSACANRIYGVNCKTASGEIFNEKEFTLACNKPIALGTRIRICSQGLCAIARCNDRGNFAPLGRTFDFTPELFSQFAKPSEGIIKITWQLL